VKVVDSQDYLGAIELGAKELALITTYIFSSKFPILERWKKSSPPGQNSSTK
jgi:hypothetical protein